MIDEKTISLNYIKKLELPGSDSGIRYMLRAEDRILESEKKDDSKDESEAREPETVRVICTYIWPEPYGFAATDPERITSRDFPLSQEGKAAAIAWINEEKEKHPELYQIISC